MGTGKQRTTTLKLHATLGAATALCFSTPLSAEVVFDGTLGPTGTFSGDFEIPDTHGRQLGSNLFHSFERFNVNPGESATFTSTFAGTTRNVIARVTGSGLSTIDGALSSTIPEASLWLINPNGLVFGADASIDVQGGFHASTAHFLVLEDGGRFDATNVGDTLLTMAHPAAFGFLDGPAAPIRVTHAALQVGDGQALSLVGGDLALESTTLSAPSGRINLLSADGAGVLALSDAVGGAATAAVLEQVAAAEPPGRGAIALDASHVAVDGDPGGAIYILGGELVLRESAVQSRTLGAMDGGDIRIDVNAMTLSDASFIETWTLADGAGGSIHVDVAGRLALEPGESGVGVQIRALGEEGSTGAAGAISISAADFLLLRSHVGVFAMGHGEGRPLTVDVGNSLHVEGAFGTTLANIATAGAHAGDVLLTAAEITFVGGSILARAFGAGDGGSVLIEADNLSMRNGTQFGVGAFGTGRGGSIKVHVSDTVTLSDDVGFPTGMSVGAAAGAGGDIELRSRVLNILEGAQLSAATFGSGNAGNIAIHVDEGMFVSGAPDLFTGVFANSFGGGDAGNIRITAPLLELKAGGSVQSQTLAAVGGAGGSIFVDVDNLIIEGQHSFISTRSIGTGAGGNIEIKAAESIELAGNPGLLFTGIFAGTTGEGAAGNISIETGRLMIADAGLIQTSTFGAGNAGTIVVDAGDAVIIVSATDPNSGILNNTFAAGHAGSIFLSAPTLDISGLGAIEAASAASGDGGEVFINVGKLSLLDGGAVRVLTLVAGTGGSVDINAADSVLLSGQGEHGPSSITSETRGSGRGGPIYIVADTIRLVDGALLTAGSTASGAGGDIRLEGRLVELSSGGLISASSTQTGRAGTISVTAADSLLLTSGSIETSAPASAGGNIDLNVVRLLFLDGGLISAAAGGVTPEDAGGNITIDPQFVILRDSEILASANVGDGGNIGIRAGAFVIDTTSRIDASSTTGLDGEIVIDSPHEVTGAVDPLATPATAIPTLIAQRCVPRLESHRSTLFAEQSAGGRPPPTDYLSSPLGVMGLGGETLAGTAAGGAGMGALGPAAARDGDAGALLAARLSLRGQGALHDCYGMSDGRIP